MADETTKPEAKEPTQLKSSSVASSMKTIEYIRDGEVVEGRVEQRPIKGLEANINILAKIEDTKQGQSLGVWDKGKTYSEGDIVSFLTDVYISLIDDNRGNAPLPLSYGKPDKNWARISPAKGLKAVSHLSTRRGFAVAPVTYDKTLYHTLINKGFKRFDITGGKTHTMITLTNGMPFNSKFELYAEFTDFVSNVEVDIHYTGFNRNSVECNLPEIRFGACNILKPELDENLEYPTETTLALDQFGIYGFTMQTIWRTDDLIAITILTRKDCSLYVSGEDCSFIQIDADNINTASTPRFKVNYLVRPYGGARVQNLGELVLLERSMTQKQVWDRGLVLRSVENTFSTDIHSLLALQYGELRNPRTTLYKVECERDEKTGYPIEPVSKKFINPETLELIDPTTNPTALTKPTDPDTGEELDWEPFYWTIVPDDVTKDFSDGQVVKEFTLPKIDTVGTTQEPYPFKGFIPYTQAF